LHCSAPPDLAIHDVPNRKNLAAYY
jgi:hypothetical protein